MPLNVSFKNEDFPEDIAFDIGLGVPIPNGKSVEVDHDTELGFVSKHQMSVKDYFKDNALVKVNGTTELTKQEVDAHMGIDVVVAPPESLDDNVLGDSVAVEGGDN